MKKIIGFFLALTLVISFSLVSPQSTYASTSSEPVVENEPINVEDYNQVEEQNFAPYAATTDYCNSGNANGVSHGFGNVLVYNGNIKEGACHIQYYHLAHPGMETAIVDGVRKTQFRSNLSRTDMANIAGQAIAGATSEDAGDGKFKAESYVISTNSKIRVIYYNKKIENTTYKVVITMYPIY